MTRTHGALAMLALCFALVGATTAVAAATQPIPPAVEDQHDRLLRNLRAGEAERTQAAVELVRFMERNLPPLPAVNSTATQPTPRADTAVPGRDVNVLATLLLGLIGGLTGGVVMTGWTAAARRRVQRAASAT
jgi:hypothetical protein